MNTNTYRCGCGRILGYLPSGAKESCTTCLQVRRQEAIAKAGAPGAEMRAFQAHEGVRVEVTLNGWPGASCLQTRRQEVIAYGQRAAERCFRGPILDAHDDRLDAGGRTPGQDAWLEQAATHPGLERLPDETDAAFRRRLANAPSLAKYASLAPREGEGFSLKVPGVFDEAHPVPKRLFDPARFGARKSTARFGGRTPGQALERAAARNGLFATGVDLDQHARELKGLEREPGESDYSLRTRLLHAVQRRG